MSTMLCMLVSVYYGGVGVCSGVLVAWVGRGYICAMHLRNSELVLIGVCMFIHVPSVGSGTW